MTSFRNPAFALVALAAVACGPMRTGAQDPSSPLVYVANQGEASVAVIDIERLEVVTTLDLTTLGFGDQAKPHHIVVEPDGSAWYLSMIGENRVVKFDRDNRIVGQAEFEVPGMLALHPDGERLYVGRSMSAVNPPTRIGVIRRSDMLIDEIDVFFARPHALAVHPDGGTVYSASLGANELGAIDAESWAMELTRIDGPTHALVQVAISPDGRSMVASAELTGRLLIFDLADPARPVQTGAVEVGRQPWHPVFGPDGRFAYVGTKGSNTIVAVDVQTGTVARTIDDLGIDQPHGSVLSPDGRLLLVSNNGPAGMGMAMAMEGADHAMHHAEGEPVYDTGTVIVIDLATGEVVTFIPVGTSATGIGAPSSR